MGAALLLLLLAQDPKVPVPPEAARTAAEKSVRGMFPEEKTPQGLLKLARKLLDQGRETRDNDALRYAFFREAADAAARAGAIDTMVLSLTELYSAFQIEGLAIKESVHTRIEPNVKPEDLQRLAEADLNLVQEAVDRDQAEVAAKMSQASMSLARRSKDSALFARAEAAAKSAAELKAGLERIRKAEEVLVAAPDDGPANQAIGEWHCLVKGRWDKGLPYLTKGIDGPMRNAALREFSSSADVAPLVDVADAWWDLAAREKQAARKGRLVAHARSIYATALPRSTGLIRAKIGRRLEFDPEPAGKEEEEAVRAEAALAANPNDAAASLTLGKYLAFQKNEWTAALPRLAKGSDPTLKSLAERELAGPRTGTEKVELGDAWADAVKSLPLLKKNLQDRAATWHVRAWPALDGAGKDKLRERFRNAFQSAGTVSRSPPKEWIVAASEAKTGVSTGAPHGGRHGFQIACVRAGEAVVVPLRQSVAARPLAAYELSCWVLTDETNGTDDQLFAKLHTESGLQVLHPTAVAAADQPWYRRIEVRFTAPETAVKMTVGFSVRSNQGTIFLDDVSLKQEGRELLKNGTFDQ